ncbi:hypothetical protein LY76DRAFT_111949 [Colletotrichum caudatum]|nr:hypothetical protein LY76DRAFT_111949 [Colletotrichum caudatum]
MESVESFGQGTGSRRWSLFAEARIWSKQSIHHPRAGFGPKPTKQTNPPVLSSGGVTYRVVRLPAICAMVSYRCSRITVPLHRGRRRYRQPKCHAYGQNAVFWLGLLRDLAQSDEALRVRDLARIRQQLKHKDVSDGLHMVPRLWRGGCCRGQIPAFSGGLNALVRPQATRMRTNRWLRRREHAVSLSLLTTVSRPGLVSRHTCCISYPLARNYGFCQKL